MMRWCVMLSCGDNVLSDEVPDLEETICCPGCHNHVRQTGVYAYRDNDADASLDPEFYEESTGQGRR